MKKLLFTLGLGFTLLISFSSATALQDAITWGYDEGLTSFDTTSTFRPNDTLRRDEAAKFFDEFMDTNGIIGYPNGSSTCSFYDINKSRSDLKDYVIDACKYGFLKGNGNYIMPDQKLTNAQAVTVIIRIIDGYQSESNLSHWANNYYMRAREL
jgi:hypothetical protein